MNDIDATIRRAGVVLVALVAVVGTVGMVAGAPVTGPPPSSQVSTASDMGLDVMGDDVGVWGQAPMTLRADDSMAQDTISIGDWRAEITVKGVPVQTSMDLGPIGVYDTGQSVPVTFDVSRAYANSSAFANEDLTVYAVANEGGSPIDSNATSVSGLGGLDGSTGPTVSRVDTTTIGSDGSATVTYETNATGTVQFVAVLSDDPSGGLAANATVVGVDSILVQSSSGGATAPSTVEAGTDLSMTVDAGGTGTAGHAVVLYDRDTVANSTVTVGADNVSSASLTVEPSIDRLNATARGPVGTVEYRSIDAATLFGTVGGVLNESLYADGSPSETVVLDGSMAVTTGSSNTTIDVPTSETMGTGQYRWVYVGATSDSSSFATGTVDIEAPSTPTPTTTPPGTTPTPTTTSPPKKPSTPPGQGSGPGLGGGGGRVPIPDETTTVPGGGGEPKTPVQTTTSETTTAETTTTAATTTSSPTFVERTPTTTGGPGFGIAMALVALLAVALLGLRRR